MSSANNPVNRADRDGRKIIPINLNEMELKANEKKMQIAKEVFANSPTVMNIIKTAEGENTMIHIYSMSNDNSDSDIYSKQIPTMNLTNIFKSKNDLASALTLAKGSTFIKSDVLFGAESFQSMENEFSACEQVIEFLDELMHSTQAKGNGQDIEHYKYYESLYNEIESGILSDLPIQYKSTIIIKYNYFNNKMKGQ